MQQRKFEITNGPDNWRFMQSLNARESRSRSDLWRVSFTFKDSLRPIEVNITGVDRIENPKDDPPYGLNWKFRCRNTFGKTAQGEYNTETKSGWLEYDETQPKQDSNI